VRRRLPARRNPGWSHDYLDEIWGDLKRRLGREHQDLMPVAIDDELPALTNPRRRRNPVVHEYGTGNWGVAMPTRNPRWLFKLTRDHSEAMFVNLMQSLHRNCALEGIVRTSPAYECQPAVRSAHGSSSRRAYVYWREAATVTGDDAWNAFDGTSRQQMAGMAYNRVRDTLDRMRDYANDPTEGADEAVDAALVGMAKNPMLMRTAADLAALKAMDVYVTDLNLNNWGVIPRRSRAYTLIDPGGVIYENDTVLRLAEDIPLL
jgi:hypothetical protein